VDTDVHHVHCRYESVRLGFVNIQLRYQPQGQSRVLGVSSPIVGCDVPGAQAEIAITVCVLFVMIM
jgi:hypothetical protein